MGRRVSETLEACISRDQSGIEVVVRKKGLQKRRKRWPRSVWDTEAGRVKVRAWRDAQQTAMDEEAREFGTPVAVARGTLEAGFVEWCSRLNVREGTSSDISHMRAWLPVVLPGDAR